MASTFPSAPIGSFSSPVRPTPSRKPSTPSATSKSVSYEAYAPRSTAQVSRLSRIAALTAGPTAKATASTSTSATGEQSSRNSSNNNNAQRHLLSQAMAVPCIQPQGAAPQTSTTESTTKQPRGEEKQSEDSSTAVNEAVQRSLELSDALTRQWKHTTSVRLAVRASINIAEDISQAHTALIRHSGELSAQADRLQEQATALEEHAKDIGKPLQHYDAVDRIGIQVGVLFKGTTVRGLAKIKVDDEEFPTVLQEIDEAIIYFGKESGGQEALQEFQKKQKSQGPQNLPLSGNLEYYRRALVLQEAALFLIHEAVADRIQTTTQQIQNATKDVVQADQLEASLIYTRFHGISNRSKRLLGLVKDRITQLSNSHAASQDALAAYYELLSASRTTYCNCREVLLRKPVRHHMEQLDKLHGPTGMTRIAAIFLMRLCTIETSLYMDFFNDRHKNADFQTYLATLCTALQRTVRRSLVTLNDLDTLCQIVSVLREEGVQASKQSDTVAAARAMVHLTEDAQERLIFCANRQLQKEVIRFKATPKDLDYPNKLITLAEQKKQVIPERSGDDVSTQAVPGGLDAPAQLNQVYESWFPPMRTVLRILSKIFRVVETRVFEDMALSSVQACTQALKDGAAFIKAAKSVADADLFLVKHLLILREQLSPFDMELRTVERQLDFSDAGKAVARFLANRNRRLLSMSTENAVLTLLQEGVSVKESSVDSKRDLEDGLRTACNDFIEHTVDSLAGDMVKLVQSKSGKNVTKVSESPAVITKMLNDALSNIESKLPKLVEQMSLYLDNTATQGILLKPATKKIIKSTEELKKWMANTVNHEWNSDVKQEALGIALQIEPAIKKCTKLGSVPVSAAAAAATESSSSSK